MLSVVDAKKNLPEWSRDIAPTEERILFALSAKEREKIFPHGLGEFPDSGRCAWVEPEDFPTNEEWVQHLTEFRPTVLVSCWTTPPLPASLLFTDSLPLRYLCHTTGSVKAIVPREFIAQGGFVTNWGNLVSHAVAEHALLLILASLRNLSQWHPTLKSNPYDWGSGQALKTKSLRGKKVGIHGFGGIACELIQLLESFDVKCMAFSQNVPPSYMEQKGATSCRDLKDLFRENDIIVECEALTPESTNTVTEEHFRLMPQDAVFVNVARGAIVDEDALARCVITGHIRAASDVFRTEPLPEDSVFRNKPGMIISPHIGGPTGDDYPQCGEFALSNIFRYLNRAPLEGTVTLEIYDRST